MAQSVAELFLILAIHPSKGRIAIDNIHFRYTLTGAVLMDSLGNKEFTIENKRLIPSFSRNGDPVHDMVADRIMNSGSKRRISFWINRLTRRSRFIFNEMVARLEKRNVIRTDHRTFLNIIPYRRFWFNDKSIRNNLIENLRQFLLYGRQPGKEDIMLLGLVEASRSYRLLARERGEVKKMRRINGGLLKGDIMNSEINLAIREVQAAIAASVTAATIATHSSH
ncbi:MAG TPA: GPP34 family phosphoprotein [Bacteroidales bacterium]|nr:GPP34 family phosphoprotein [Bacteroidales bacterium]